MRHYVALLRAINVGGHVVKMDRLRGLFEALGFTNVETFIASGNVLFDANARSVPALERRIEQHLGESLGYEVATFVRPVSELAEVLARHRFTAPEHAGHNLQIGFLKSSADAPTVKKLRGHETPTDEFDVVGREVFWLCRTRTSDSKLPAGLFEKTLGAATFRSVTTVTKLAAKQRPAR